MVASVSMVGWYTLLAVCVLGVICLAVTAIAYETERREKNRPFDQDSDEYLTDIGALVPPWEIAECECGMHMVKGSPAHHVLGVRFSDDAVLAGGPIVGGTGITADYCDDCCPGGCNQGCEVKV